MRTVATSTLKNARLLVERRLSAAVAPRGFAKCVREDVDASCPTSQLLHSSRTTSSGGLADYPWKLLVRNFVSATEKRMMRTHSSGGRHSPDYEEESRKVDLAPHKLLEKGMPDTHQAVITSVIPVGYFLKMPSGRTAYLPAADLGISGGVVLLEELFKVGQELTVRITGVGGGRDIVSMKKLEFAPPDKDIFGISTNPNPNPPPPRGRPRH